MNDNYIFKADGFKPIHSSREISTASDAAREFGHRLARREFGRTGYCHHARQDHYTDTSAMFQVTITKPNGYFRNEWIHVEVIRASK